MPKHEDVGTLTPFGEEPLGDVFFHLLPIHIPRSDPQVEPQVFGVLLLPIAHCFKTISLFPRFRNDVVVKNVSANLVGSQLSTSANSLIHRVIVYNIVFDASPLLGVHLCVEFFRRDPRSSHWRVQSYANEGFIPQKMDSEKEMEIRNTIMGEMWVSRMRWCAGFRLWEGSN